MSALKVKLPKSLREQYDRNRERGKIARQKFLDAPMELRHTFISGYTVNPTEFEVQAYLYGELIALGFHVRGEVKSKCGSCIFDLVVYSDPSADSRPVKIIEVKKRRNHVKHSRKKNNHQISEYSLFGVSVELVCGLCKAREYIARVKETRSV